LTPTVNEYLENNFDYLFTKFGIGVCNEFLARFEEVCDFIGDNPTMYPLADSHEHIRRCVVTEQNIIYYSVNHEVVEIITIFDTREHLASLNPLL